MNVRSSSVSLRKKRREVACEHLLEAAERVLYRKGYLGATMNDVAREAGCATGTLYLYFKNKDELFHALVLEHLEELTEQLLSAFAAGSNPVEKLRLKLKALLDYFAVHRGFFAVYYAGPGVSAYPVLGLSARALKIYEAFKRTETEIVRSAQQIQAVRTDLEAEELVELVHGTIVSALARWSFVKKPPSEDEQFRTLWAYIAAGMQISSEAW